MMFETEQSIAASAINDAIANGHAVVFKGIFTKHNPEWERFIHHINDEFNNTERNEPAGDSRYETAINNMLIRKWFYMIVRVSDWRKQFPSAIVPTEFLSKALHDPSMSPAMSFIQLVQNDIFPTNVHSDPGHTFYWQCQGESEWMLFEEYMCPTCNCGEGRHGAESQILLEPGDVIFVPKGMKHTVKIHTPRAALVFRSGGDEEAAQTVVAPNPKRIDVVTNVRV